MPRRRPQKHQITIPAAVRALHESRLFVDTIARAAGLDAPDREAFDLAVTEAISNAIRHGSPRGEEDQVEVTVNDEAERLVVTVRDHGVGFIPDAADFTLPDPKSFADHGRGLYLIHALMDEVEYSDRGGTTVRMTKKKKQRHAGPGDR